MEKSIIKEYLGAEMTYLYDKISYVVRCNYRILYNQEEAKYKRSPEYTKARNKAYWNKPKQERDQEAFKQALAKLDYWMPRRSASTDTHISYSNKVDEEISNEYSIPIGFTPSISEEDFFEKEATKIQDITDDNLLLLLSKKLKAGRIEWCTPATEDEFFDMDEYLSSINSYGEFLLNFSKQLIGIYNLFNIPIFNSYVFDERKIITNGCVVEAFIIEQNKPVTLKINVEASPVQVAALGKMVGDRVKFANLSLTYRIDKISR